jgi:hypothetical protein
MKNIHVLVEEFREALIRGFIPPLEMGRIIQQMSASLAEFYPEVFEGLPINLDDVSDEVWMATKNFGNHEDMT